jgi:hypothetical protein
MEIISLIDINYSNMHGESIRRYIYEDNIEIKNQPSVHACFGLGTRKEIAN